MAREPQSLQQLLDQITEAANDRERVSLGLIIEAVGSRSFGPLLLLVGIILFSPLSGIPGMPTAMSILVLLVAVQMLFQRSYFWLPQWLLNRSLARSKLLKALKWLERPAQFIDRWSKSRLTFLVRDIGSYAIALVCIAIAAATPLLEVVPFSATGVGAALSAFGMALVSRDGLLALFGFVVIALAVALITYSLV